MEKKLKDYLKKNKIIYLLLIRLNYKKNKMIMLLKAYKWILFNFQIMKKKFKNKGLEKIKPYKIKEWRHEGIYYFIGEYNYKKIFIKYMRNSEILLNEWNAYNELKSSKGFKEKYFIKYLFYEKLEVGSLIVSEYLNGKTLGEKKLTEMEKEKVTKNLIRILDILYSNKIIHRDINPTNIYFENDKIEKIKIIDFAYAMSFHEGSLLKEQIKDNKILKNLNFYYNKKIFHWDDAYSVKKMMNNKLIIYDKNIESRVGRLYYEKKV